MSATSSLGPRLRERAVQLRERLVGDAGLAGRAGDPSAAMFTAVRRRLTLQYAAILAAILLLAGLALYTAMSEVLLNPVDQSLTNNAQFLAHESLQSGLLCPPPEVAHAQVNYVACYTADGQLIVANQQAGFVPTFTAPTLVQAALASSTSAASDTFDAGALRGATRRYALVIRDPQTHRALGVVQVGDQIEGETRALHTLLVLLLLVGTLTIGGAALGGLFLSRRALAPARMAFTRQQTFIADASHELRTPLTLLRADAEVLLRGREQLDPDDALLLEDIVAESEHMSTLVSSLLTLARLDSGVLRPEHEVVDLGAVARGVARRVRALAEERGITLDESDVGEALVIGDRALFEQATLILLDNAIKYNQRGGSVTARTARTDGEATLEIRDTGVGIDAEHLPHLGERFYRVDKARSREVGGAGLGLSIARGIATLHHGTLTLSSVPGEGTSATLRLPAAQTTEQPEPMPRGRALP